MVGTPKPRAKACGQDGRAPSGQDVRSDASLAIAAMLVAVCLGAAIWGLSALVGWLTRPSASAGTSTLATITDRATGSPAFSHWRRPAEEPPSGEPAVDGDNPFARTRINGRVFDVESHDGLAGAVVRVTTVFSAARIGKNGSASFTSGEDGQVALLGIPPGEFEAEVIAAGFVPFKTIFKKFSALEDDDGFNFPLVRSSAVEGRVVDASGAVVPGARVVALSEGGGVDPKGPTAMSGVDGRFVLDPADARELVLFVSHPAYSPATHRLPPSDEPSRSAEIVLAEGRSIAGVVRDAQGPIAGAQVGLDFLSALGGAAIVARASPIVAITDIDGRYHLALPASGIAGLHADAAGRARAVRAVQLESEDSVDFELAAGVDLVGRVLDPGGHPLADARVMAMTEDQTAADGASDPRGAFRLSGLSAQGPYYIRIFHPGYPPFAIEETELRGMHEYRLEASSRILGWVRDAETGKPIREYEIRVRGPVQFQTGAVSPSGAFEVDRLTPGTYALLLSAQGYAAERVDGLVVSAGKSLENIVVQLRHDGRVSGRVVGPGGGGTIVRALNGQEHLVEMTSADEDGRYQLENLPPGTYTLVAAADGVAGRVRGVEVGSGSAISVDIEVHADDVDFDDIDDE